MASKLEIPVVYLAKFVPCMWLWYFVAFVWSWDVAVFQFSEVFDFDGLASLVETLVDVFVLIYLISWSAGNEF